LFGRAACAVKVEISFQLGKQMGKKEWGPSYCSGWHIGLVTERLLVPILQSQSQSFVGVTFTPVTRPNSVQHDYEEVSSDEATGNLAQTPVTPTSAYIRYALLVYLRSSCTAQFFAYFMNCARLLRVSWNTQWCCLVHELCKIALPSTCTAQDVKLGSWPQFADCTVHEIRKRCWR
jgi:hypothetical protein